MKIKTWLVTGTRVLADGGTKTLTASAFGKDQPAAERNFGFTQALARRQALEPAKLDRPWEIEELTFVEVEQ
jgi:hypothetical protein